MTRTELETLPRGSMVRHQDGKRGDLMTVFKDADYVEVVVHPSDVKFAEGLKWQRWRFDDVY